MVKNFDQLSSELKKQLRQKGGWENLYYSVNQIAGMINAISESKGDEWMSDVTTEEDIQLRNALQPHSQAIRNYFGDHSQKGGADPTPSTALTSEPSVSPVPPAAPTNSSDSIQPPTMMSMMPAIDLDAAFTGLVQKTEQLNQTAEYLSSQYGLTRIERDFDTQGDFQVVPNFLTTIIGSTGPTGMALKEMLDKLKVPYRFIVFLVYLYLDISRLTASTMGYSNQQRILTVILALLELFRGDWKKAVLTFMGFYGSTPLLAGQIGKVLLYLFERLSPTIQDRMVYGAWDASKSLLVGILLSIFQLVAPLSVRKPFMDMLDTLAKGKKAVDDTLIKAGLPPRSDQFEPTWENINRLQAVNRDPVFICSCEYQEVLKKIDDSALVKLILQLLGLPVNEEMKKKYTCADHMPCKPFVEGLRDEQKSANTTPSASSESVSSPPEETTAETTPPAGTPPAAETTPPAGTTPPPPFNSGQPAPPSGTPPPPPFNSGQPAPPAGIPPPPPFNSGQPAPAPLPQQMQYQVPQMQYQVPQMQYQVPQMQYQVPQMQYQMPQMYYPQQQPLRGGRSGRVTYYKKKRSGSGKGSRSKRRVSHKKHLRQRDHE